MRTTISTTAAEMTFGVEIETTVSQTAAEQNGLRIGFYRYGKQVSYLPSGWIAEHDCSVETRGFGRTNCEIISPILKGADGLAQVADVVAVLGTKSHTVNKTCGVHVHVGWDRTWPSEVLARLITIVAYVEKGLYAITGSKNRERGSYCGGIRKYGKQKDAKTRLDRNRYHVLNVQNLAIGGKSTVEFRAFSGSLDAAKIIGWIQVCLGLVERSLICNRMPSWSPKPLTGGWKKGGPGASEAERLMGYLAWGAGYARIHGGKRYGWISDIIPQKTVKETFRRLAKKYDEQP